jgi:hypothetical protein
MARRLLLGAKAQFEHNSIALASGQVKFLLANTSTLKNTYSDYGLTSANTNPVILNAQGRADIVLEEGLYDVEVYDANANLLYTVEDVTEQEAVVTVTGLVVDNPNFENVTGVDADNWTTVTTWGTIAVDATDQDNGQYSLKFTSTGAGGGEVTSTFFPVTSLETLSFYWSMKSSVADVKNIVNVLWYDDAQSQLAGGDAEDELYNDAATNPTSWTVKSASVTPPADARWAVIELVGCDSSDATSGSTWFDRIRIERATAVASCCVTVAPTTPLCRLTFSP